MANNYNKSKSGLRQSFTGNYIEALSAAFAEHGARAIETCAKEEPAKFLDICSRLVPRDVAISLEHRDTLGPAALEILRAIQWMIPDADSRPAGEVLTLVSEAVRIHMEKPSPATSLQLLAKPEEKE